MAAAAAAAAGVPGSPRQVGGGRSNGLMKEIVVERGEHYAISRVDFGILSSEEIPRYASMQVYNRELYDLSSREPFAFGCLDTRLGVSRRDATCTTCRGGLQDCAGHFGFVRLVLPVFHIGYFKHTQHLLCCICKECARILLCDDEDKGPLWTDWLRKMRRAKMGEGGGDALMRKQLFRKLVLKLKTVRECPHCGAVNGPIKKVAGQPMKLQHDFGAVRSTGKKRARATAQGQYGHEAYREVEKTVEDMNPLRVYHLFRKMIPTDCEILDIVEPQKLLLTHVLVPPVCIRPSVSMGDAGTTEDDLTIKIAEIVQTNSVLSQALEKGNHVRMILENWEFLQLQIALFINSEMPGIPQYIQQQGRPARGICQRLKGKEGRFRGNLSGKRVDFSGRTVISPDPNVGIDQVVVPEWVAKRMTYPESVCSANIGRLRRMVLKGYDEWPGACFVIKKDGSKQMLKYGNKRTVAESLSIGDVVERHLRDGDVVLFNRQPSLHRCSIMAHRAKVMPWRTFRFNECVCAPYNADFDGDEMNLHLPQTEEARAEATHLMSVVQNLITPKNGDPIVSATQDFLTCSYLLTRKDTFMTRAEFCQACCSFTDGMGRIDLPPPAIIKPVELWTGKQVVNVLLRPTRRSDVLVNMEVEERDFSKADAKTQSPVLDARDGYVVFHNSELMCGALGKATLGGSKKSLFFQLIRDNSPQVAADCMGRLAKLSGRWLSHRGFTIGIDDVTPSPALVTGKEELIERGYKQVDHFISLYKKGQLESQPGCDLEQTLEVKIKKVLDELRGEAGQKSNEILPRLNKPLMMFLCGAKGQLINLSQMIACVGQQNVAGQRIQNGFVRRTLPHFRPNSKVARARGFVSSSFYSGLGPDEFFFHTMSGREGLVDTAVKTADTGYLQRRLMKALEDLSTQYDRSVRTSSGQIVQFVYGDDGLSPSMMEGKDALLRFNHLYDFVSSIVRTHIRSQPPLPPLPAPQPPPAKEEDEEEEPVSTRERRKRRKKRKQERGSEPQPSPSPSPAHPPPMPGGRPQILPPIDETANVRLVAATLGLPDGTVPVIQWGEREGGSDKPPGPAGAAAAAAVAGPSHQLIPYERSQVDDAAVEAFVGRMGATLKRSISVFDAWRRTNKARTDPPNELFRTTFGPLLAEAAIQPLAPSGMAFVPLLPYEVLSWVRFFLPRTKTLLPRALAEHQRQVAKEGPTHQEDTGKLRIFNDELLSFWQDKAAELADYRSSRGLPRADDQQSYQEALRPGETGKGGLDEITVLHIAEFLRVGWQKYARALAQPGEAVGAVAAQSIGEPGTQMTLKTFHFAGVASMNVTLGVPRIKEIINAAKTIQTPVITVPLKDKHLLSRAKYWKNQIEKTKLSDICVSIKEVYNTDSACLTVKLDPSALDNLFLTTPDVAIDTIRKAILCHPPLAKLKLQDKNLEVDTTKFKLYITTPDHLKDRDANYFTLQAIKTALPETVILGIKTIKRGVINQTEVKPDTSAPASSSATGKKAGGSAPDEPQLEYSLAVEGYGLQEVMNLKGVDGPKVRTNHVMEMQSVLGIEAARYTIIEQIRASMRAYGLEIDVRHMDLLGDVMTYRGEVLGISRFGIAKMRSSTLMLASFEETNEHLFEAAFHHRQDPVAGVSECIIMGKPVQLGTGRFDILYEPPKSVLPRRAAPLMSQVLSRTVIAD
ncbi:unnamed protein product [Vitrella brassicaformis CCMP3155]|uniref:DNA-directed RNA polymerase subunit n=1 Tax=Vitrella brassicaformis (strain CCMP3155) TaxID=1169540 RepID=A0A0G4ECV8_VITBC|nr:unnamed protein product [Vitrella brassicaformis CCMP3155]|eukprot:CEL93161.1 unnamed protein product [Vitrella brassicaformis CCMP3155]